MGLGWRTIFGGIWFVTSMIWIWVAIICIFLIASVGVCLFTFEYIDIVLFDLPGEEFGSLACFAGVLFWVLV